MKHNLKITFLLVGLFFISQIIGLLIVRQYIKVSETGEVMSEPLPGGIERPEASGTELVAMITIAILIGTGLLLLLIRFKKVRLWKLWYSLSVIITLFFVFGKILGVTLAIMASIVLAYFKIFKPSVLIHNITEVFIYGGLAAIFVPIKGFTVPYAIAVLLIISVYDIYAVWHSKHMVKLANFTTQSKVFAGLSIPYNKSSGQLSAVPAKDLKEKRGRVKNAILGGGDIGFPLLFAGTVMKVLILNNIPIIAFLKALIVPICATIALYLLFVKGQKNKFYPAMPFLTAGCLAGYAILLGVNLLI